MPNQFTRTGAGNAGPVQNFPFAPGIAPVLWNPFLSAMPRHLLGAFGTIAREWQEFVGRLLKEDVALVQRLARCSTPDQVLSVYTGEDYGKEINTMADLMTDMAGRMAVAAQSMTDEAGRTFQREAA